MKQPDWDKLVDYKPIIKQLVDENKWDEVHSFIAMQKRYDFVETYKASEKSDFGFSKGYMNIIDIAEVHWNNFLKDYFITKYPDIVVLDYKTFFKKVRASYNSYNEYTYKDEENKLANLDLDNKIYLMNVDTGRTQMYDHMIRKMKKDHKMLLNIYTAVAPNYRGKSLLQLKQVKLYQHIRYSAWSREMSLKNNHDFIIN